MMPPKRNSPSKLILFKKGKKAELKFLTNGIIYTGTEIL